MIYLLNPFTKTMLAQLRRGRAIELSKTEGNICIEDDFKGDLAGLCRRGLGIQEWRCLMAKRYSVYFTQAGKFFLDQEDAKKLGSVYYGA